MSHPSVEQYREFLKDTIRQKIDFSATDQQRGVPAPPLQPPVPADARRIELVQPGRWDCVRVIALETAIRRRESVRDYTREPLGLEEIAFLLWATQGVRQQIDDATALRTVPSAGARHALETHLCALSVPGLQLGVYRYLPLDHQLLFEHSVAHLDRKLVAATFGQSFLGAAAAVFVWTAVPYRMEWRYGAAGHKLIAIDAGHACQNLYLAGQAVGAGVCALAAYHQQQMDELLRVDGQEEFTVYMAAVGKV